MFGYLRVQVHIQNLDKVWDDDCFRYDIKSVDGFLFEEIVIELFSCFDMPVLIVEPSIEIQIIVKLFDQGFQMV